MPFQQRLLPRQVSIRCPCSDLEVARSPYSPAVSSPARTIRAAVAAIVRHAARVVDQAVPSGQGFVLRTYPSVEDTGRALWEAMDPGERDRLVWLVDDPARLPATAPVGPRYLKVASLAGMWAYLRSSTVLHTHGVYALIKPASSKTVVNLWHGMPIKRLGSGGREWEWQTDATLVTAPTHAPNLEAVWNLDEDQVWDTGLPRTTSSCERAGDRGHSSWSISPRTVHWSSGCRPTARLLSGGIRSIRSTRAMSSSSLRRTR